MSYRPGEAALRPLYQERASSMAIWLTKPTLMLKRNFRSACITPMLISCRRSKTHWLESGKAHSACVRPASNRSPKLDWKPYPGRAGAESARSDSTPDSESGGGHESLRSCEHGDGKGSRSRSTNRERAWRQDGECLLGCARHF